MIGFNPGNVNPSIQMSEIKEYKIHVPQEKIDRLKRRLDETEFPTELEDDPGWQYGSPMYALPIPRLKQSVMLTSLGRTSNASSTTGAISSTGVNMNAK